jgi:hypothetical protein
MDIFTKHYWNDGMGRTCSAQGELRNTFRSGIDEIYMDNGDSAIIYNLYAVNC